MRDGGTGFLEHPDALQAAMHVESRASWLPVNGVEKKT